MSQWENCLEGVAICFSWLACVIALPRKPLMAAIVCWVRACSDASIWVWHVALYSHSWLLNWKYHPGGFMGPTWGPCGANRTQVGPMFPPCTLLSGFDYFSVCVCYHPSQIDAIHFDYHWVIYSKWSLLAPPPFELQWQRQSYKGYIYRVTI